MPLKSFVGLVIPAAVLARMMTPLVPGLVGRANKMIEVAIPVIAHHIAFCAEVMSVASFVSVELGSIGKGKQAAFRWARVGLIRN